VEHRVQSATPFDWKTFLHQRALLPEEVSARYAPRIMNLLRKKLYQRSKRSQEILFMNRQP